MEAKLRPKQRLFCEYYVSHEDTHGNAVKSYALAYGYGQILPSSDGYDSVKANANRLLNKPEIKAYIGQLLQEKVLDSTVVTIELGHLIRQNENLAIKRLAISDYCRLAGYKLPHQQKEQENDQLNEELEEKYKRLAMATLTKEEDQRLDDALDAYEDFYARLEEVKSGAYPTTYEQRAEVGLV